MKKLLLFFFLCFLLYKSNAQLYYKGEWSKMNKHDLFTGIFKITIKNKVEVSGELVWTYLATDSSDHSFTNHYKEKKGRKGIEYVEGSFNPATNDIYFEGRSKDDPDDLLGLDKYSLKLSANKEVLYGKTDANGDKDGMIYAIKLNAAAGEREFNAAKLKVKK